MILLDTAKIDNQVIINEASETI